MDLYVVTHGNQSNPNVGDYVKPHGYSQILTAVAAAKDFMKGRGGEHAFKEVNPQAPLVKRQYLNEDNGIIIWIETIEVRLGSEIN